MRAFVVAGSPQAVPPRGLAPGPEDWVVAADSGALHALTWGWQIDLLVGDLDSLPAAVALRVQESGVPVITAPMAKDETDLELALAQAVRAGPSEVIICAALGGRADHMLANIMLLTAPALAALPVRIAQGIETIRLLRSSGDQVARGGELCLHGRPGDLLSLLPIVGDAVGVTTRGLLYPLFEETLFLGAGRGISNVFQTAAPCVSLRSGALLVVHTVSEDGA